MNTSGTQRTFVGLSISLVVLAVVLVWSLFALGPNTTGAEVSFDEAQRIVAAEQVQTATLHQEDRRAAFITVDGREVWTAYPDDGVAATTLVGQLVEAGAVVTIDQQWGTRTLSLFAQFILPLLLLANLFGIFILLARGGSGQVKELFAFSRIGARRAEGADANPFRFRDVAAASSAITELTDVAEYLRNPQRFAALGAQPPKGVLLYGPPGCGKTLLAKALAGEVGVPFYFFSGSEFVESLVGVGAARVRDLFRQAVTTAPSIVFIDELDAAGRRRGAGVGGGNDEREQTLNEILVQMDGFEPTLGVVVIAATNRPDILDPALLRPGRFDRHVALEPPDAEGRLEILELHAAKKRIASDTDLAAVAKLTPGTSGADLANLLNEAALLTVRRGGTAIEQDDLIEAVDRVLSGPRRQGRLLTEDEIERLAYHEAGHAVVAANVEYPADVHRISIVARGRDGAHTAITGRTDRSVLTRSELEAELTIAVAGAAAEILVTGEPSTAIEADLEHATDLARRYAGRYGMSDDVGRIRVLHADAEVFLGRDLAAGTTVSGETQQVVDRAVKKLIADAERRALQVLQRKRADLDRIASALIDRESLDADELAALLKVKRPRTTARKRA